MQTHEWKRHHQVGLVITQFLRTLFAPLWLIVWPIGWLIFCLNDAMTPVFWPPFTGDYLVRCCGREFSHLAAAQEHIDGECSSKGARGTVGQT